MLKTQVVKGKKPSQKFPCLMVKKDSNDPAIVLFSGTGSSNTQQGCVMYAGQMVFKVGDINTFSINLFEPFYGSVKIQGSE